MTARLAFWLPHGFVTWGRLIGFPSSTRQHTPCPRRLHLPKPNHPEESSLPVNWSVYPIGLAFGDVETTMAPDAAGLAGESGEPSLNMGRSVKPLEWEIALSVLNLWKPSL